MTRTLFALHRRLLRRLYRKEKSVWANIIIVWLYGVLSALGLQITMYLSIVDKGNFNSLGRPLLIGVLAYWVLCLIYPTPENQLTPAWFAVLPIRSRDLLPGLTIAAIWQSRGLLVVVNSAVTFGFAAAALLKSGHVVAIFCYAVGVIAAGVLSIIGGEVLATLALGLPQGRGLREKLGMLAGFGVLFVIVGFNFFVRYIDSVGDMSRFDRIAAWTPWGAGGGMAAAAVEGQWALVIVKFLIAIILIPVGLWLWNRNIAKGLVNVAETGSTEKLSTKGTVMLPGIPRTLDGALMSRQLIYYRRDRRLLMSLITIPAFAVMFMVLGLSDEHNPMEWYGGFGVALFGVQILSNSLGYDGPANWLHMVASVDPKRLMMSRIYAMAVIAVPLFLVIQTALGFFKGFSTTWFIMSVICLSAMIAGSGLGSVFSVYNPFPTARPGTNPYKDKSGYTAAAFIAVFSSLFGVWLPLLPGIVLMVIGEKMTHSAVMVGGGAVVCILLGIITAWVGVIVSAKKLARSWPEVFSKVSHYV